ncbi:MAG: hypothetical protein GY832_20055, partial [Chloroflexi bacterium]|nr:hypothetical protein [Chloroflexota bacterium]
MRNKTLPQEIEWVEPENYLSINWEPKGERHPHNLMPTPYEEITRDEFDALLHCNSSGLAGINYRQVFLDDEEIIGVAYFYLFRKIAIAVV